MLLSQQQQQQTSSATNFRWRNNQQNAMAFNPAHEQVFMDPHGFNSYEVKMQDQNLQKGLVHESSYPHNMVFQMQHSSQHYSHA